MTAVYFAHKIVEVTYALNGEKFVVKLIDRTCTYNFLGIVAILCHHAVAAIRYAGVKPESFVHEYYSMKFDDICYSNEISTMNDQRMWKDSRNPASVLPPEYKRGAGRQKKLRRREPNEESNPTKLRRKKILNINAVSVGN